MIILQATELVKHYTRGNVVTKALDGVNLKVESGEFLAVVGSFGSGKTTLLHMMGGLDIPTSGSVKVQNEELSQKNEEQLTVFRRRHIGFVFQQYNLVSVLNVRDNIALPVRLDGNQVDKGYFREVATMLGENGDIHLRIQGFPGEELHREEPNIKILEGSLDEEKFASGGYLIYNQGTYRTGKLSPQGVRVGDQLSLSFYDLDMQQYVDKTLEVMAVVERVNPYPTGILARSALTLSDRDFKVIYPLANQMIQTVQIHGEQELTEEQYQMIEGVIQGSFNSQLSIGSRFEDREDYQSKKVSMTLLGLFLSSIFGMIGLCNIINTQVTDILTRKIEYAAMQSIGMTKHQMQQNIWRGSLALCGISVVLAIPVGILLTQKVTQVVFAFSGFSLPVFLAGCLILLGIMIGLSASISGILTGYLNRKPVVERLREAE